MSREDQQKISIAKTDYREAYNTGDVERLLSVYASKFTDCSDGEPSFYGEEARRALRLRAEDLFQRCTVDLFVIIIDIVVKGDFAYDWGWHKMRITDKKSGETTETKYRYFETWHKENDAWRINYVITNKELPPKMLPDEAGKPEETATERTA